jgi:CRP-like cAMP-binding protein
MIDFEKINKLYTLGKQLTLSDVQVLFKSAKTKSYASGEHLIVEGETKRNVFLIRKGLVRAYKINEKGDEITTLIRWENKIVASPNIILFNEPSQLYFETLEPTEVFYIDYDVLQTIISSNPKLESNRKFILQNVLKETLQRIDSFILLTPEERYLDFRKQYPDIVNRVPNKFIANILGITPVSLSRIRKRIVTKKDKFY